jgi:hypothetical protein
MIERSNKLPFETQVLNDESGLESNLIRSHLKVGAISSCFIPSFFFRKCRVSSQAATVQSS